MNIAGTFVNFWKVNCLSEAKFTVPVIGRGRQHQRTCDMFLHPLQSWPSLEWWGQTAPSSHQSTVFAVYLVFLCLSWAQHNVLGKWVVPCNVTEGINLWDLTLASKSIFLCTLTQLTRLLCVLYTEFSLIVANTAFQRLHAYFHVQLATSQAAQCNLVTSS